MNVVGPMELVVRWMKFNLIGAAGIVVQLGTLHLVISHLQVGYFCATLLAVELTLLHNFTWHCIYTWRDRPAGNSRTVCSRLVRFHLCNGIVSLTGNALLMYVLVGMCGLPILAGNMAAILACSLVNYLMGDRIVFLETARTRR